ncbi:acyl-CoA dehydrogenase family protein [Paenirhodobacter sp.]|uniref:acyl-CoA dehydrogenase family protein n=1 Tax=Paenirhodobacter sp. TaxID=1965326 RepID=UPI003B3D093E
MTQQSAPPHENRLTELRARFAPVFAQIGAGAAQRDIGRILPHDAVAALRAAGFTRLRAPVAFGGFGADLRILFALVEDLAEADSNLSQILRGHFGFGEIVLAAPASPWRDKWLSRIGGGEIIAPAFTETGEAALGAFSTRIFETPQGWVLEGEKYYTTGTLFADWVDVGAVRPLRLGEEPPADGAPRVLATVRVADPGVTVQDDWDGFGQRLTASGTTVFAQVPVEAEDIRELETRPPTTTAFYQQYHLATLAGIGRAAAGELARHVAGRRRTTTLGTAPRAAEDPQVLQLVGKITARAASASRLAAAASATLDTATAALHAGASPDLGRVEIEIYEAQVVIAELVLAATTEGFSALGASSTARGLAFDRFWRNARTLANHNPLIFKERLIGDFAVNGTYPPGYWQTGIAPT